MKRSVLSKSSMMAVVFAVAVVVWMLTGLGGSGAGSSNETARGAAADELRDRPAGLSVTVLRSTAERVVRDVVVSGRTEPSRTVEIKAETEGRVVQLGAERGSAVAEGARIALLDERERRVLIAEAETLIEYRRQQHEAALRLEGQQLVAQVQIAEAKAQLAAAEAQLERTRLDLARTSITAPFDGMLEERNVELGDYVGIGDAIAVVVDNDPLIAVGEVSEREVGTISPGTPGRAQLVNGKMLDGVVRYVSPVADQNTRTFRIEIALANSENRLPAGMTAELRLPAGEIDAHFLSPALLTLDDSGNIGVKTVDAANVVHFHAIEIIRSASDGIWVTGLPAEALVISVGQGFVAPGERVEPIEAARTSP